MEVDYTGRLLTYPREYHEPYSSHVDNKERPTKQLSVTEAREELLKRCRELC